MYCQINTPEKIKALMRLIGKEQIVPAFEKHIGPWEEAKLSNFYALGLGLKDNKGVLYYRDGSTPYGTPILECLLEYILKIKDN